MDQTNEMISIRSSEEGSLMGRPGLKDKIIAKVRQRNQENNPGFTEKKEEFEQDRTLSLSDGEGDAVNLTLQK